LLRDDNTAEVYAGEKPLLTARPAQRMAGFVQRNQGVNMTFKIHFTRPFEPALPV